MGINMITTLPIKHAIKFILKKIEASSDKLVGNELIREKEQEKIYIL